MSEKPEQMPDNVTDRPLVTFALFAYNQEQYIREAVEGAFAQIYEPLEIILSDDCSSDRTYEIMQEMAAAYDGPHDVRVRRNKENLGFSDHINAVVKEARGIFIVWAAGDDVSLSTRVKYLVKPFSSNPRLVGTYSDIREIDTAGVPTGKIRRKDKQVGSPTIINAIERRFAINTQSHCFRKNMMEQFPPLNSDLTYEEPCMTVRELLTGCVEHVPKITVNYRVGSGVSTYQGKDIDRIKRTEPAKVAEWRRSSSQQIFDDLQFFAPNNYKSEKENLKKKISGAARLREINLRSLMIRYALQNLHERIYVRETIRAFIRRNSPVLIFVIFKKIFSISKLMHKER